MKIDYPAQDQQASLQHLWQEAFHDPDSFWALFYEHGFAPDRCRCVTVDGVLAAALYWFDCSYQGKPMAYLYGVATDKKFRGQGICRALMENTHSHLKYLGYAGAILVPAGEGLSQMYEKMGYTTCSYMTEFSAAAGMEPVALREVDGEEFCRLRRGFLPEGGVVQEGDSIEFLENMSQFYAGEDFLLTVARDEEFFAPELLGNTQAVPGILAALRQNRGRFRVPGKEIPFAMYCPLSDTPAPTYFGLAFD